MSIGVKSIKSCKPYQLILEFSNGEERATDWEGILNKAKFCELSDPKVFCAAHVCFDTIERSIGLTIFPMFLFNF